MNSIKNILSALIIGIILMPYNVNADTFTDGKNVYVLQEREISCIGEGDFLAGTDKNNDLIFINGSEETLDSMFKVNSNNECVEMSLQEKYDFLNTEETYLDMIGGGLWMSDVSEEYKILEYSYSFTQHGNIKTTDTTIDPNKEYYTISFHENNTVNYVEYVNNPDATKLDTYYEALNFSYPTSAILDPNQTYYHQVNGTIFEKVSNPTQENMSKYYILKKETTETKTFLSTVNQEAFKVLLEEYGSVFISKHKENNNLYIGVLTDIIDYDEYSDFIYSVYNPDGTAIEIFKDIYSLDTYHNSLIGVSSSEGLKIYDSNYKLLYSNKDIKNLTEYGHANDIYQMSSYDYISDTEKYYTMKVYKLASEDNQTYKNSDLTMTYNNSLSNVSSIKVNNKELDKDNYSIEDKKLTLKKDYLSTLDKGTYTLTVEYSDEVYVTSTFNISKNITTNPQTYDGITNSIIIAIVSIICLLGTIFYLRKNKRS